ncbi:MAG: hypothetical protein HKP61_18355 [Dactylosporangium sp.]|nr:hypothetical protein [Dactylosporangium sp.]NNJ62859.1 hypothetical protein [Dactylosporangium sp.]
MRRRTTVAIISTFAGSTLLVGLRFAIPAAAGENGWSARGDASAVPCVSGSAIHQHAVKRDRHRWHQRRHRNPHCIDPSATPTASGGAQPTASGEPTGSATPTATTTATPTPSQSATAACTTIAGAASNVVSPGVGAVTVTIQVCDGAITTSTGVISESNWDANDPALASLDALAVEYYASDLSKITYSGATLTADAYRGSLESAMSEAGL